MQAESLVIADEVSKRFGRTQALDGVTLEVRPATVHGLVGRNGSGKSTLVSVLTGLVAPDAGEVRFEGKGAPPIGQRNEWRRYVACVYQSSSLIPELTVAENLQLGRRGSSRFVSWRKMRETADGVLAEWNLDINPSAPVAGLGVHEQQLIEIIREMNAGSRVLILDEPTTRLSHVDVERLMGAIRSARERGIGVLFISHYLQEAFQVCDTITVLRDGGLVCTVGAGEATETEIVAAMVGGSVLRSGEKGERLQRPRALPGTNGLLLEVKGLAVGRCRYVTFVVGYGECVGLAGTLGSGNREVAECLTGLLKPSSGEVTLGGMPLRGVVRKRIRAGVGFVPPDRADNGLVPVLSVEENITMTVGDQLSRLGVIPPSRRRQLAKSLVNDVGVVGGDEKTLVRDLSGGNQQKVVVGRALATRPRLLVLADPTAGVDVAARGAIFDRIRAAMKEGIGVLVVSQRPEELALCERILVMVGGRITAELDKDWSEQSLVAAVEGV